MLQLAGWAQCALHRPAWLMCRLAGKGGMFLAAIEVRDNESLDSALRRFKRQLQQTGVLEEARRHERYEKPSDRRRRLAAAANRRKRKEQVD